MPKIIGNWQSEIGNKKNPALNNAGLQIRLKLFGSLFSCPSCLAGYFAWPQVALTHHVFIAAYTPRDWRLSRSHDWDSNPIECLVSAVTMICSFSMTDLGEANKYM